MIPYKVADRGAVAAHDVQAALSKQSDSREDAALS
jgi:hypothetical protein